LGIKIITDSTSYLPESMKQKYDISIVSLSVAFENDVYKEIDITNEDFFNKLKKSVKIPKSSQPSIEELYNVFENEVKQNNEIVGIFISSEMSGTYSTALMVKNMIIDKYKDARIEIIDSRSNCMQLGYAVLQAAKAAKEGRAIDEVIKVTLDNMKRSRFVFIPETLEYLKKGGRIGTAKALLGNVFQIRPILTVKDGKTHVMGKVRTRKRAIEKLVNIFLEDKEQFGLGEVLVHHINCEEEAKDIAEILQEKISMPISRVPIGPVIGTHVGPGTIAIVYYTKDEIVTQ